MRLFSDRKPGHTKISYLCYKLFSRCVFDVKTEIMQTEDYILTKALKYI